MTTQPVVGQPMTRAFDAQVRKADQGVTGREFTGIAVPWDDQISILGFREKFAAGSIEPADNVLVCWRHDEPVGRVTGYRDAEAGWEVDGQLSDTTVGRDAAALLADGVIDKLSIRFEPLDFTQEVADDGVTEFTYTRARVTEVSLVPFPAYANAGLSAVRHEQPATDPKENPMTTTDAADVADLRGHVDELDRRLEMLQTEGTGARAEAHPLDQFRSMGDYVKRVAAGDDAALRAYQGLVLGEVSPAEGAPSWAGGLVKMIDAKTPSLDLVNHTKDLPPQGNYVEYAQILDGTGLKVAEQLAEGDDLVFGKLNLKASGQTAKVHTIGGWTDESRQSIERSPLNVIDLTWRGFILQYANYLEAFASKLLADTYAAQLALGGTSTMTADLTTADGLIDFMIDAADRYSDTLYSLDAVLVAPDVFKAMAKIPAQPKALQITNVPTDKLGTLSVNVPSAQLGSVNIKLWKGAPAGAAMAIDGNAIKVQESPGAPFRLQDENIVNLTKQFSVYGYVAGFAEMPQAIVPIVAA